MSTGDLVVDANALLRLFFQEPGAEKVLHILEKAQKNHHSIFLNLVNYGEIYYSVKRKVAVQGLLQWKAVMDQLPVQLYPITLPLVEAAAELKVTYRLPYADAFCAATALQEKATLVTGDRDFRRVENVVAIYWTMH